VSLPLSVSWVLTVAFAGSAGRLLYDGVRRGPGTAARISAFVHVAMCGAMIAMVWPQAHRATWWPQAVVYGAGVLWFGLLAVRARRTADAVVGAHHTLAALVMAWMLAAPMPAGAAGMRAHGSMEAMTGPPPAAVVLTVYFLAAALVPLADAGTAPAGERSTGRLTAAACHAVMSAGIAVLTLTAS